MEGSLYSTLLFDEPISMGRRIAGEIRLAEEAGRPDEATT